MTSLPAILSAAALVLAIVNALYGWRRNNQHDWAERIEKITSTLNDVCARLGIVETKTEIWWRSLSVSNAIALHSPHTPELDVLLEKYRDDKLTDEKEISQLKRLLWEVVRDDPNTMRKKLASDILALIYIRFEIGGTISTSGGHPRILEVR